MNFCNLSFRYTGIFVGCISSCKSFLFANWIARIASVRFSWWYIKLRITRFLDWAIVCCSINSDFRKLELFLFSGERGGAGAYSLWSDRVIPVAGISRITFCRTPHYYVFMSRRRKLDRSFKGVKVTVLLSDAWKIIPLGVFRIYFADCVGLSHTTLVPQSHGQIRKTVLDQCSQYRDLCSETCIVFCVQLPLYHEPSTGSVITATSCPVSKASYSQYKA